MAKEQVQEAKEVKGACIKEAEQQTASNRPGACRCECTPECKCGCCHPHDCGCCEDCPCEG